MNIPSVLVLFVGGWGVASDSKENLFYGDQFSFLEEAISSYPSLTIKSSQEDLFSFYQTVGAINTVEDEGLTKTLANHEIKLITIAGAERYGLLNETMVSGEEVIDEQNKYYFPCPPGMTLSEYPETNLPQISKQIEMQFNYAKDAVVFAGIETISSLYRYKKVDLLKDAIKKTDKQLRKIIEEALTHGVRILLIGDSPGAENIGQETNGDALLPVVLIARELEGLRASEDDYASGSLFPLTPSGSVEDIAPTILSLMHIPKPQTMPGKNLFEDSFNHL